jgi:hypothetical protein
VEQRARRLERAALPRVDGLFEDAGQHVGQTLLGSTGART